MRNNPVTAERNVKKSLDAAHALYQMLISPVAEKLSGIKRLVIIPDGLLGYLPFEILLSSTGSNTADDSLKHLPYLLTKFIIRYEHSATIAVEKRNQSGSNATYMYLG